MINYGKGLTNCNFDTNEKYLYVTGFNDVSRIRLKFFIFHQYFFL